MEPSRRGNWVSISECVKPSLLFSRSRIYLMSEEDEPDFFARETVRLPVVVSSISSQRKAAASYYSISLPCRRGQGVVVTSHH